MDKRMDWEKQAEEILRAKGDGPSYGWDMRVWQLAAKLEAVEDVRIHRATAQAGARPAMDKKALEALARQYKQYKCMEDELKAELDAIADAIKAQVPAGVPVIAGEYKIRLVNVAQARIDATALRRDMPDVAEAYSKDSSFQRLTIS